MLTGKDWAVSLLAPALIAGFIVFVLIGVEIWSSVNIDKTEKLMWTLGLVFMGSLTSIIYFVAARKRITKEEDPFHPDFKKFKNGI